MIRHNVQGKVVVANKRWAAAPQPDSLTAACNDGRRSVLAEYLVGAIIISDQGAD